MNNKKTLFRLKLIIGTLPNTLANGQTADAVPLMADLNFIVTQVNANAAPLANTALLNAANSFTQVQSGVAATGAANFPIATQVQNHVFNTLSSTVGSNAITGRIAALPLAAYAVGQIFSWLSTQRNSAAATLNVDGVGAGAVQSQGLALTGGELGSGAASVLVTNTTPTFELLNPPPGAKNTLIVGKGDVLSGTAQFSLGRTAGGANNSILGFLTSETTGTRAFTFGTGFVVGGVQVDINSALSSTQITGTSVLLPVTPNVQQTHASAAKVWGVITPPTTVTQSYPSAGVSVVKNAVGDYTVVHGARIVGQYAILITPQGNADTVVIFPKYVSNITTNFRVLFFSDTLGTAVDPVTFSYACFGQLT